MGIAPRPRKKRWAVVCMDWQFWPAALSGELHTARASVSGVVGIELQVAVGEQDEAPFADAR